jgi:drug/metabolite transporter (DMT)-like permease
MNDRTIMLRLLGVTAIWGLNYVSSAYLLREFSPIFLSYSRLVLTSVFLLFVAGIAGKVKRPTRRQWGLLLAAAITGTLLNQLFYFTGLQTSTAGNAALIVALSPVATLLLARLFLHEVITLRKLTGAAIALSGVVIIVVFGSGSFGMSLGDIYLLLCMLAISVSLLIIRRLSQTMSSYDITILGTIFGTVIMTPAAVVEGVLGQIHFTHHAGLWLLLAASAIIGTGLTSFWWNDAISSVGASASAMFMNVPPFVAIVASYFLLGDPIRLSQMAGGVMILAGVALANGVLTLSRKQRPCQTNGNEM